MSASEYEVLFICAANVGRSQMAEGFYNNYRPRKAISAAGVEDRREKYKFIPAPDVINLMRERGIDISSQRIKLATPELVECSAQVVFLEKPNSCFPFLRETPKGIDKHIDDPHKDSESSEVRLERIRIARDAIEQIVLDLLAEIQKT